MIKAYQTIALFLMMLLCVYGCDPPVRDKMSADIPQLTFSFDKRVETMYIVLMLTGKYDMLISQHTTSYKQKTKTYFEKHKKHHAIKLATTLIDQGFSFDYAASWICQFSDFPGFQSIYTVGYPLSDSLKNGGRTISKQSLADFQQALISFYHDAECDNFFTQQESFASVMLTKTQQTFTHKKLPQIIENYYGIHKQASFTVILSPLLHSGGYEVDCKLKQDSSLTLVAMVGPDGVTNGIPLFDTTFLEQDLIIHEFGHSYEYAIVERYMPQTLQYEKVLFPPVKTLVENEGYSEWTSFMHELIVRSVTLRIVEQEYGKDAAAGLLAYEKSVGFGYVEYITDELKKYEQQRNKYPTLEDFFPQIIKRLGQIPVH